MQQSVRWTANPTAPALGVLHGPNGRFLLMHRQSQVADQALQVVSTASWQEVAAIRAEAIAESLVWAPYSRHIAIRAAWPYGHHVSIFSCAP